MNTLHGTKKTNQKTLIVKYMMLLILLGACVPFHNSVVQAQTAPGTYTLLEPLPCLEGTNLDSEGKSTCTPGKQITNIQFKDYVQYIFNLLIALAAVLSVFMIVWGGFRYVSTDSFTGKNEGKDIIWKALQGLLLVLTSFLILRTIDPRLVKIPTNLVKPLEIPCKDNNGEVKTKNGVPLTINDAACSSGTGSFFQQMATSINKADRERIQAVIEETKIIDRTIETLEQQRQSLIDQRDALSKSNHDGDDEKIDRLTAEIGSLDIEINKQKDAGFLKIAEERFKIELQTKLVAKNLNDYGSRLTDAQAEIARIRKEYLLRVVGPDSKQVIYDQSNYATAVFEIQKYVIESLVFSDTDRKDYVNKKNLAIVDAVYKKYASSIQPGSSIKNPEILKKLAEIRDKSKTEILTNTAIIKY